VLSLILGTHATASDHGAFAERIRVDARRVVRVPEAVEASNAALVEPAAAAAHAVAGSGQRLGDTVVVIGAGTVGLLVAELARMAGAARLVAVDVVPERRELAASLGADAVFSDGADVHRWLRDHGHGLGADVVYECAGHPETLGQAVDLARLGGTVVLLGTSQRQAEITPLDLVSKHLRLIASLGYTIGDVHRALDLMAEDRFRMSAIHARLVGFDDLVETFAQLAEDLTAPRKVLFTPAGL
jgi:(R,R)-butanediol dehydrogenase/meso-butanediol dehydrogenase/diacetyl reductase